MSESYTHAPMTGTLPVCPFTAEFIGTIQGDGQSARVSAIVCQPDGSLLLLSLVGFDTTLAAIAARLYKGAGGRLTFAASSGVQWEPAQSLQRHSHSHYRQCSASIPATRERHLLILAELGDIAAGILHPAEPRASEAASTPEQDKQPRPSRVIFGNLQEETPHALAFLGHLRALSVVFLPPWAGSLWQLALRAELIRPLPTLGMRAWSVDGDPDRWSALVRDGIRNHQLHAANQPV
jgi:hypothetical protein